ncbi:MAG: glycoside hydrolase family 16 protein [Planctomycetota bacterium]
MKSTILANCLLVTLSAMHSPCCGTTLLRDDFSGNSLNQAVWRLPTGPGTFFGRTQIRPPSQPPVVDNGVVTLLLDTHNPTALTPGDSFWGHEIQTFQSYSVETGLSIKSRLRFVDTPPGGLVGGFFTFGLDFPIRDEIDFELLSNAIGTQTILTNVFEDDDFNQGGDAANVFAPGLDITEFAEYEIRWLPDRIEWFVNGTIVRREFDTVTDDPQEVRINLWAPNQFFGIAYNPALQPVANAAQNEQFSLEVDFVEISRLPAGDLDASGSVDGSDFLDWQRDTVGNPLAADDLATWLSAYGAPLAAASVPEPTTTATILLYGLLAVLPRRRSHCR